MGQVGCKGTLTGGGYSGWGALDAATLLTYGKCRHLSEYVERLRLLQPAISIQGADWKNI